MVLPHEDRPFIFATVGTDHHPFDRLTDWIDAWFDDRGSSSGGFMQIGTSRPPRSIPSDRYIGVEEVDRLIVRSNTVVCHAGPGTVMQCRRTGLSPIVVPRSKVLGEHVDGHQIAFALKLEGDGVPVAWGEEAFRALLDRAVADPDAFRGEPFRAEILETSQRFERLVDEMLGAPARLQAKRAG